MTNSTYTLTDRQQTLLTVLRSDPLRGFTDTELTERTGLKNITASIRGLLRNGYALSLRVAGPKAVYQAAPLTETAPE